MRRKSVTLLNLTAFSHATEDPEKVKKALLNLIPKELRGEVKVKETQVKGHHGNEIRIITVGFTKRKALSVLRNILCGLSKLDREILYSSLQERTGARPSKVYLRLDKQEAFLGRLRVMDGSDVIRVEVTVDGIVSVEELRDFLEEIGRGC